MLASIAFLAASCESKETLQKKENFYLPSLTSQQGIQDELSNEIKLLIQSNNGRIEQSLDFSEAISATSAGYENSELIFIPNTENTDIFSISTEVYNQLSSMVLTLVKTENGLRITNDNGTLST